MSASASPSEGARSENILTLTGASVALSLLIYFISPPGRYASPTYPLDFAPPVAILTVVYHITILILPRLLRRNSPDASFYTYAIMRPATGLAAFLITLWLAAMGFMIAGVITFNQYWYGHEWYAVQMWVHLVLTVVEVVVMLSILLQSIRARKAVVLEPDGQIQL